MPDDTDEQTPATPGERRLARPPSERYEAAAHAAASRSRGPHRPRSEPRGVAFALVVALVGATLFTVAGGVLTLTGGLLVVAVGIGWATTLALRAGAGTAVERRRLAWLALLIAVAGVVAGGLGLWLYAAWEGGVLGPVDYLLTVFGAIVPLGAFLAGVTAWVTAR